MIGRYVSHVAVMLGVAFLLTSCGAQHTRTEAPGPERSLISWPLALNPFGTIMEYSDGLSMTVEPMQKGLATKHADGASRNSDVLLFLLTITNGTPSAYDPQNASMELEYSGLAAPQVFDSSHTAFAYADGIFDSVINPGGEGRTSWLFAIPEPEMAGMRLRVSLDPARSPSYFAGGFSSPEAEQPTPGVRVK